MYTAEAKDSSVPTFTTKHTTLQNLAETLFTRHKEVRARDEAVRKAENALKEVEKVVAKWHKQVVPYLVFHLQLMCILLLTFDTCS